MAIIYTNQSSGAIRKAKKRKPTKSYLEALQKHIKFLKKLGFDCDDNGRIKLTTDGRYSIDIAERTMRDTTLSDVPLSNKIGSGGTNTAITQIVGKLSSMYFFTLSSLLFLGHFY